MRGKKVNGINVILLITVIAIGCIGITYSTWETNLLSFVHAKTGDISVIKTSKLSGDKIRIDSEDESTVKVKYTDMFNIKNNGSVPVVFDHMNVSPSTLDVRAPQKLGIGDTGKVYINFIDSVDKSIDEDTKKYEVDIEIIYRLSNGGGWTDTIEDYCKKSITIAALPPIDNLLVNLENNEYQATIEERSSDSTLDQEKEVVKEEANDPTKEEKEEVNESIVEEEKEEVNEPIAEEEKEEVNEPIAEEEKEEANEPIAEEEKEEANEPIAEEEEEEANEPIAKEEKDHEANEPIAKEEKDDVNQPTAKEEKEETSDSTSKEEKDVKEKEESVAVPNEEKSDDSTPSNDDVVKE